MKNPDLEQIAKILQYEPETGAAKWLPRTPDMFDPVGQRNAEGCCANWNARYAGRPAMTYVGSHGYRCGNLFGKVMLLHRVAMGLILGGWDFEYVDHINGDKLDNRALNLRPCSNAENLRNGAKRKGSSRYKGVCFHRQNKNWIASITVNYKTKHLGSFCSEIEAAMAYDEAAKALHGNYARLNFDK
jgi:hypothetical protein